MPTRQEVKSYFKSITSQGDIHNCHRCGRLMNYEKIVIRKKNKITKKWQAKEILKKLKVPLTSHKWHDFKLCDTCFEDKENKVICHKVDLEHLELLNLTYAYIHKQL